MAASFFVNHSILRSMFLAAEDKKYVREGKGVMIQ